MSYELIAILIFSSMMLMLLTGQRVFGAIGGVATIFALLLWGKGAAEMPFNAAFALLNWYPLLTLPLFIYMGYMFSESGIASDLYRMFHVWMGSISGGLAIGTMGLMVAVSAMNGLSVAGMAIGASLALPEMLKRNYDKVMVTGVIQAGSSLGIMVPPSVVLVLYGMIARQPVGQLWLAGVFPGLLLAGLFMAYIYIRCRLQPHLGPALSKEDLEAITWGEKLRLLRAGIIPLVIIFTMTGLFLMGITSLVQCSAAGATATTLAAFAKGRLNKKVLDETLKNTPKGERITDKTRHNMKSCLHQFFEWVNRREKAFEMPEFPEIEFELGWRRIVSIEIQQAIIDEVKKITWDVNPKIWLGIKLLATYIKIRPDEMRNIKEQDISLESGFIHIPHPKEGSKKQGKYAYLDPEDIELIKAFPRSISPDLYFFRHTSGRSGVKAGEQFGPNYFKKWWDKACKNLGIQGVDLYGGTKHSTATALGELLTPEQIKRGGTGSATNKAFERYFQPRRTESLKVTSAIRQLRRKNKADVVGFVKKK